MLRVLVPCREDCDVYLYRLLGVVRQSRSESGRVTTKLPDLWYR